MTVTLDFRWNKQPFVNAVRAITTQAMQNMKQPAFDAWLSVVPIGKDRGEHEAGTLRDSWDARVIPTQHGCVLYFGATAPYAIYVELGTGRMAPRAPVRKTAELIAPLVHPYLVREAAAFGIRVS